MPTEKARLLYGEYFNRFPEFEQTITELEKLAEIRATIRSVCGTDDLQRMRLLQGHSFAGILIDSEFIAHAEAIDKAWNALAEQYRNQLQEVAKT